MNKIAGLPIGVFMVLLMAAIAAFWIVLYALLAWALRRQMRVVSTRWQAEGVSLLKPPASANYRGHLNSAIPVRGNGVIGLTNNDLRFAQLVPWREFVVPLRDITRVEVQPDWKHSRRAGMPVLAVYYYAEDGREDAIGIAVDDPEAWRDAVAAAAGVSDKPKRSIV